MVQPLFHVLEVVLFPLGKVIAMPRDAAKLCNAVTFGEVSIKIVVAYLGVHTRQD